MPQSVHTWLTVRCQAIASNSVCRATGRSRRAPWCWTFRPSITRSTTCRTVRAKLTARALPLTVLLSVEHFNYVGYLNIKGDVKNEPAAISILMRFNEVLGFMSCLALIRTQLV